MDELFARITWILGWSSGGKASTVTNILSHIHKESVELSQISLVSVIIFPFSEMAMLSLFCDPLFVEKGRMVGTPILGQYGYVPPPPTRHFWPWQRRY